MQAWLPRFSLFSVAEENKKQYAEENFEEERNIG